MTKQIRSGARRLNKWALAAILLSSAFMGSNANAVQDAGYYWVCDLQTGEYVCGYASPYGHCQYTTWNGEVGYLSVGQRLQGWYYDCRDYVRIPQ